MNTPVPEQTVESYPSQGNMVTVSDTRNPEESIANQTSFRENSTQNTNEQIIEELKEQRDKLRAINDESTSTEEKPKHLRIKYLLIFTVLVLAVISGYSFIIRPRLNQPQESPAQSNIQKNFTLPSDLASKTSDEKSALNIIELARKNDTEQIIATYLNRANLGQTEADFKSLINSYNTSADGENVELVEKTIGTVDFASTGESSAVAETSAKYEAASLIYKSGYYKHTNNLYLKINLYKPDPAIDMWKLYVFEFKAGEATSPFKADIHIPI